MKVSVVVPVFNTGTAITALIDSLRAQTLAADQWEAVFVDDGSTDDTADVVEGLIAEQPNMRLLREEPSGWPGRPRNVGMDAAAGDYVFFSDDDDTLGPEALERLVAFADTHRADVVVPRTVGRNRGVPAIGATIIDAQDHPGVIMSSLAPQKLFRLAFLRQEGIRFVEGHFRLEDHLFVTTAYLRAKRVSVFADYPCYYLSFQPGRPHISQQRPDWHAYFGSVRACLDRVDAEVADPERRRALRGRWLRAESLSRLRGSGYAKLGTPELVTEVRQLLADRYDAADLEALSPIDRMLARLLLDGEDAEIAELAAWEAGLRVRSEVTEARIDVDGSVRLELTSTLLVDEEAPLPAIPVGPHAPSVAEVLAQAARFTDIGVELQHVRTKERRPAVVAHEADGRSTAVLAPADEPLATGRWTVVGLAGEHRSRHRTPVAPASELQLDGPSRRVGQRTLRLLTTKSGERLLLHVAAYVPPAPVPLTVRIKRRLRRLVVMSTPQPQLRQNHG